MHSISIFFLLFLYCWQVYISIQLDIVELNQVGTRYRYLTANTYNYVHASYKCIMQQCVVAYRYLPTYLHSDHSVQYGVHSYTPTYVYAYEVELKKEG